MKIYIKYLVSNHCKKIVKSELQKINLKYGKIEFGEIEILENITVEQHKILKTGLKKSGMELLEDKRDILVEKIKIVVGELIYNSDNCPKANVSEYISKRLHYDYTYLANVFSEATASTIEHYVIAQKIERAKEMLICDKLNLTQIARKLKYSSVAHLSNQFKKVTGLTTSFFKLTLQRNWSDNGNF